MRGLFLSAVLLLLAASVVATQARGEEATARSTADEFRRKRMEKLARQIRDSDEWTRAGAIDQLGDMGGPQAVEMLMGAFKDSDSFVRCKCVMALGRVAGEEAIPALVLALEDKSTSVRRYAAEALYYMDWKPQTVNETVAYLAARSDWEQLASMGAPGVDALIRMLRDEESYIRRDAAQSLGQTGEQKAVGPLIQSLSDGWWDVCEAAASALDDFRWKPQTDHERVWYLLAKRDVQALVQMGSPAVEPLVEALQSESEVIRSRAAVAFGSIHDARAASGLVRVLADDSGFARKAAAEALDKLNWKPQTEDEKANYLVATQQWEEAVRLGPPAVRPLIRALKDVDVGIDIGELLVRIGPPGVDLLIEALTDRSGWIRLCVAGVLDEMGDTRAVGPLITALENDDFDAVREAAAQGLGRIGAGEAVPVLVVALRDKEHRVRSSAADALDKLYWTPQSEEEKVSFLVAKCDWEGLVAVGEPAMESLEPLLSDRMYFGLPEGAVYVLGRIGGERATERLIELVQNTTARCRIEAAIWLGRIGDPRSIGPLIDVLSDRDESVRHYAAVALGETGAPAFEALMQGLRDTNPRIREGAAKGLGTMRDRRACAELIRLLGDSSADVRKAAAWALGSMKDKQAISPLLAALKDTDEGVRRTAALALQRIDPGRVARWRWRQRTGLLVAVGVLALLNGVAWFAIFRKWPARRRTLRED